MKKKIFLNMYFSVYIKYEIDTHEVLHLCIHLKKSVL